MGAEDLKYGDRVRSSATLSAMQPSVGAVHPKNFAARQPGVEGVVLGLLGGVSPVDWYWVAHDNDCPAVYCRGELEEL